VWWLVTGGDSVKEDSMGWTKLSVIFLLMNKIAYAT